MLKNVKTTSLLWQNFKNSKLWYLTDDLKRVIISTYIHFMTCMNSQSNINTNIYTAGNCENYQNNVHFSFDIKTIYTKPWKEIMNISGIKTIVRYISFLFLRRVLQFQRIVAGVKSCSSEFTCRSAEWIDRRKIKDLLQHSVQQVKLNWITLGWKITKSWD